MNNKVQYFHHRSAFQLENLQIIPELTLAYHAYGQLNMLKNNVVWVFHAFTANSDCLDWWKDLFVQNPAIDPEKHFIICVNMPGSCYGSIGPLSINPITNTIYYYDFPEFSIKDIARVFALLQVYLGIEQIHLGIGGSMGGQVLLTWSAHNPGLFENMCLLATNARHSAYGIAFNTSQRAAITLDSSWGKCSKDAGLEGMKIARSIALLSYRTYESYAHFQTGKKDGIFRAESYQHYQGKKLAQRFNALSYYYLTKSMDSHCLAPEDTQIKELLQNIKARILILAIENDVLFPLSEQIFIANNTQKSNLLTITSMYGHDGFLLEINQIKRNLNIFMNTTVD